MEAVENLLKVLTQHNRRGGRPRGRDQNRDLFPRDEFELGEGAKPL
jgi:hypothetical protein